MARASSPEISPEAGADWPGWSIWTEEAGAVGCGAGAWDTAAAFWGEQAVRTPAVRTAASAMAVRFFISGSPFRFLICIVTEGRAGRQRLFLAFFAPECYNESSNERGTSP